MRAVAGVGFVGFLPLHLGALSSQVIEIGCMNFGDAEEAAKAIVREAYARQSEDNLTVTVVQFGWQEKKAQEIMQALEAEAAKPKGAAEDLDMFGDD